MPLFRKRPVTIEARVFDGTHASALQLMDWMGPSMSGAVWPTFEDTPILVIQTLEGEMAARPGDYVIRGVQGEFYPCKPDIFAATYEPASEPAPDPAQEPQD
jgi:hypothetical protein